MRTLFSLTGRNMKIFFKDKAMFFTSLITPAILLVLYSTFLAKVYNDAFIASVPKGMILPDKLVKGAVGGQLVSSLLAVSCVTVTFCSNMLSQYLVLDNLSLMNTRWAIILPAIFSTFPVFLIYRGFSDIPKDVLDSARIDGANEWNVLRYIGLPLGKSGVLACIVLCFLDYWNMVEQPLAFIKDKTLFPLSLYLPMLDLSNADMILVASVITLIPAVFVFVIGQDHLEQGIIAAALKERDYERKNYIQKQGDEAVSAVFSGNGDHVSCIAGNLCKPHPKGQHRINGEPGAEL